MALTLTIENFPTLPDGGPISFTASGARGFDLGRDTYLDWTLPDPSRYISGKHCEVRYQNGDYVLYDVSTNGTFLNGNDRRMHGPHVLRTGDRLMIGNYIIVAHVEAPGGGLHPPPPVPPPAHGADLWDATGAAPPASRSEIVPRASSRPIEPDFLEWAMDPPPARAEPAVPHPAPVETPRRSVWVDSSPTGAWAFDHPGPQPPSSLPAASSGGEPQERPASGPASREEPGPHRMPVESERAAHAAEPRPPEATPANFRPPAPASAPLLQDAVAALCRGAGLPPEAFARRDSIEVLEEAGASLRVVSEHLMRLLSARSSVKRSIRSAEHTTIAAQDNNPFKFSPTAEDALRVAFGPPTRSYLHGPTAFTQGFDDIAGHQLRIFSAMQQAIRMLVEDLDPTSIEAETGTDKAMSSMFSSRKARHWDTYCTTWRAKTQRTEDGISGLFMIYFAECYDRLTQSSRNGK